VDGQIVDYLTTPSELQYLGYLLQNDTR